MEATKQRIEAEFESLIELLFYFFKKSGHGCSHFFDQAFLPVADSPNAL